MTKPFQGWPKVETEPANGPEGADVAIPYLSVVRLRDDVAHSLDVDVEAIGVVVGVYDDGAYEVEFSDDQSGATKALLTLTEDQIEPVAHHSPVATRTLAD